MFEPWNGEARRRVPVDLDAGGFLRRFQVRLRPEETTLLIKETATRPRYLQAIDHLLESLGTDRRLIWIHRDPLHTFLSEMAARKAWWGQTDLTMDTDTFARWARRSFDAVRTISRMALRHPTLPIAYERLVRDPEGTLRHLMRFLGLEFDPAQLAYHTSIDPQSVRGDLNLARQPMPISEASRLRRDQESAQAFPVIARSPLFEQISAVHRILSGVLESDLEEGEACRLIAERLSPWVDASR